MTKVSDIQANGRPVKLYRYQTGMTEVPNATLTGCHILLLIYFLFLLSKAIDTNIANFVQFVKILVAVFG